MICAVYGEGAVTDWTCQKWFAKFPAGDVSLDNAPWSHRPVYVDSDQIKILTKNNQWYTMQEIGNIFKISKLLRLLVKKNFKFFILWKKLNGHFGQCNIEACIPIISISFFFYLFINLFSSQLPLSPGHCGLVGWTTTSWTEKSWLRFLAKAHAWVMFDSQVFDPQSGPVSRLGQAWEGSQLMIFSHINVSLFLHPFSSL